jgi:hypothetical protein
MSTQLRIGDDPTGVRARLSRLARELADAGSPEASTASVDIVNGVLLMAEMSIIIDTYIRIHGLDFGSEVCPCKLCLRAREVLTKSRGDGGAE